MRRRFFKGPDVALGAALRELEIPEHRPGFYESLVAELHREASQGGLPAAPMGHSRASHRHKGARRRTRARRLAFGFAAAAIAALIVLVNIEPTGIKPRVATASEVRTAVAQAWASAEDVSGRLIVNSAEQGAFGPGERSWSFALTAAGDFRLKGISRPDDLAYDVELNVERSLNVSESLGDSDQLFASERTGLAPGPPDRGPSLQILDRSLGSVVRALASGQGGRVREIRYQERPAWLLDTDIRINLITPEHSPDHLEVTVDRQTGFPVRIVATRQGEFVRETRVEDLKLNTGLPADSFTLTFPPDMEAFEEDYGFRRVRLDEVIGTVGYPPLVPTDVPAGFELAEVAVSLQGRATGSEGGNPPVGRVVSQSYRRGLDQFIVTTRPVGDDPTMWDDPLASGEGFIDRPEQVTVSSGALAGRQASLLIDPLAVPHIWLIADDLVVTVSGDLDRNELLRVVGSLN